MWSEFIQLSPDAFKHNNALIELIINNPAGKQVAVIILKIRDVPIIDIAEEK